MKKILINARGSLNNGDMAMVIGTVEAIREKMPSVNFTLLSYDYKNDKERYKKYGIRVVEADWIRGTSKITKRLNAIMTMSHHLSKAFLYKIIKFDLDKSILKEFIDSDLILDLSGDSLTDDYGIIATLLNFFPLIISKNLKRPYFVLAQSLGPYSSKITRLVAKEILNNAELITVREQRSLNYLKSFGIANPNLRLVADLAFLLNPIPKETAINLLEAEGIKKNVKPIVGISPSTIIHGWAKVNKEKTAREEYISFLSNLTSFLIRELNCTVVFLAHVTRPQTDDRIVGYEVQKRLNNFEDVKVLSNLYDTKELKGIIGVFDMFIGFRMHPTIASASLCIPTISYAYSQKTLGIFKDMLGLPEYTPDIRSKPINELLDESKKIIFNLWQNRDNVSNYLESTIPSIKEKAIINIDLIINFLKGNQHDI
jgi:colanic acid/amylovoran biosynthesis protein